MQEDFHVFLLSACFESFTQISSQIVSLACYADQITLTRNVDCNSIFRHQNIGRDEANLFLRGPNLKYSTIHTYICIHVKMPSSIYSFLNPAYVLFHNISYSFLS